MHQLRLFEMLVGRPSAVLIDYDFRIGGSHFRGKGWRGLIASPGGVGASAILRPLSRTEMCSFSAPDRFDRRNLATMVVEHLDPNR